MEKIEVECVEQVVNEDFHLDIFEQIVNISETMFHIFDFFGPANPKHHRIAIELILTCILTNLRKCHLRLNNLKKSIFVSVK